MFATLNTSKNLVRTLLIDYSFDLNGYITDELIACWHNTYPLSWLHLAVIEALYQGRYKAISVRQILAIWHKKGQVCCHFNLEFENLICRQFTEKLAPSTGKSKSNKTPKLPQKQKHHLLAFSDNQIEVNDFSEKTNEYSKQQSIEEIPHFPPSYERYRCTASNTSNTINTAQYGRIEDPVVFHNSKNNFPDNSKTHLLRIETHPSIPTRAKTNVADLLLYPDDVTSLAQEKITHIESCNLSYPPICKFVPEHNKHSYLLASKLKAISTD